MSGTCAIKYVSELLGTKDFKRDPCTGMWEGLFCDLRKVLTENGFSVEETAHEVLFKKDTGNVFTLTVRADKVKPYKLTFASVHLR